MGRILYLDMPLQFLLMPGGPADTKSETNLLSFYNMCNSLSRKMIKPVLKPVNKFSH